MKVLFKALRFLISYFVSTVAIYISGYGNLLENIAPAKAAPRFFLSTLVIAIIVTLIWEMYLKIIDLSKRLKEIEER